MHAIINAGDHRLARRAARLTRDIQVRRNFVRFGQRLSETDIRAKHIS
jgi:hypothetical protein